MAGVETTELGQLTLTPMCLVTVRADGIQLQDGLWARPFQLGGPELQLLAALSRQPVESPEPVIAEVAERSGATTDRLQQFVTHLRYSGRLRPVSPWRHRDVPDHPTLDQRPPLALQSPESISFRTPQALRLSDGVFEIIDHDGLRTAVLTPREVEALALLVRPATPAKFAVRAASDDFDDQAVAQLLGKLDGAGLLRRHVPSAAPVAAEPAIDRDTIVREIFDRHASAQDAAEHDRVQRTGRIRPKVVPVAFDMGAPAGVGMVVACAKAFDDGGLDDHYDFRTDWVWSDDRLDDFTRVPAVYLLSDYLWSHERCIDVSKRIKERSPSSITIHGGPDAPKYEADTAAYFAAHPHVDVLIRGEGELTTAETLAALMSVVGDEHPDLSVLAGVTGITYRDGEKIVRNGERDRVVELDDLPSPYLTGLFDVFKDVPDLFVTLETNRGCPYSCTFCDWGSATNSRIRKFDLDRVYAELEWCADVAVASVSVADANFGIFERDVEIAAKVAELRTTRGHPQAFGVSFAKNTVKHLQHIITVLADAGIMAQGVLSLQTMDDTTLDAIHRSNIKTEKYDALADEMRGAQLPLMVELMMGLPGQTLSSFADDIQQCIDREVPSRVNHTALLVNSPMNDPEYRAEHQIQVSEGVGPGLNSTVISTSSFTTDDYAGMEKIRLASLIYENFGALRLVSRFVRQETGVREMDFYQGLRTATEARPESWPALFLLVQFGTAMMAPPYSWALVMADLHDYLVSELGVVDDDALDTVLRCQRALLPAHGRQFPEVLALAHDMAAWHQDMQAAKGSGHRTDWPETVARLVTYGPGEIRIDDPHHIVDTSLGLNSELSVIGMNWEFDSPLSRARLAATQLVDWATDSMLPLTSDDEPSTVSVDLASG